MLYRLQDKHGYLNRFSLILLGLVPFMGVTGHLSHALVYLLALLVCLSFTSLFTSLLSSVIKPRWMFPAALAFNSLVVLMMSVIIGLYWDFSKEPFLLYLQLLSVSPLIMKRSYDQSQSVGPTEGLKEALQDGITFGLILVPFALVREFFAFGTLSLPGLEKISIPFLSENSFGILAYPSGGLVFLGMVLGLINWFWSRKKNRVTLTPYKRPSYRPVKKDERVFVPRVELAAVEPVLTPEAAPAPPPESVPELVSAPSPKPVSVSSPEASSNPPAASPSASPEPSAAAEPAGYTLTAIFSQWQKQNSAEKKRILVIGCGTGEEVYRLAMYCHEIRGTRPEFGYRIRGVDNFASRIETALEGVYRESQVEDIPLEWKKKYVLKSVQSDNPQIRMVNEIRLNIEFEVAEYTDNDIYFSKPCDLVLINQNIDFYDEEKRQVLFRNVQNHLKPQGFLFMKFIQSLNIPSYGFKKAGEKIFQIL